MKQLFGILVVAVFLQTTSAEAGKPALHLTQSITVNTDDWYPLPEDDIRRSVTDAALAILTPETRLRFVQEADGAAGRLRIDISLIGKARTAKATLTVDSNRTGSLVSTASVSLDGMDQQRMFHAFEHIGSESARRLAAQLDVRASDVDSAGNIGSLELKALFDRGMAEKRQGDFVAARDSFLRVMQHDDSASGNWPELAADEIRYGLPMYHAKHLLFGDGRFSVSPENTMSNLDEAERLLRQVYAENSGDVARVTESQRLLDQIELARTALRRSMQANSLAKMTPLKMMLTEQLMTTGECPAGDELEEMREYLPAELSIDDVSGTPKARTYRVFDPASGMEVDLNCDAGNMHQPISLTVR